MLQQKVSCTYFLKRNQRSKIIYLRSMSWITVFAEDANICSSENHAFRLKFTTERNKCLDSPAGTGCSFGVGH